MESVFRTPEKGDRIRSAPAKVLMAKSEQSINVSSRKCLFPDKTWRSKDGSDDDDVEKSTLIDTSYLKPSNFYGNSAPIPKTDFPKASRTLLETNNYKSRVRLFHDGSLKRKRSCGGGGGGGRRPVGSHPKRPKNEMYTGVSHSIKPRKPVVGKKRSVTTDSPGSDVSPTRSSPKTPSNKQFESPNKTDNIYFHDSLLRTTRKTPRSKKKSKQDSPYPWLMKFTKARREEVVSEGEGSDKKRKFFKSAGKSPKSPYNVILPEKTKRRKLLNEEQDASFIFKQLGTASDILDLIEDGRVIEQDDEKREENVAKLIGQLDDENDENMPIDNLMDITENTGNLSITDSPQSNLNTPQKVIGVTPLRSSPRRSPRKRTPTKLFSIFDKSSPRFTDISNISGSKSSSKTGTKSPSPVKLRPISSDQLQIDVGQKKLGEKVCPTCSLVYQSGDPDDEIEHEKYHNNFALFKFLGWQNERVIRRYRMDRVILVLPADQKAWWDRVKGLLEVIDKELGYLPEELHPESQFLMYISNKRIVGCLAALPVHKAYKMLMSESDIDMCSEESFPVKCAVSRIWTQRNARKTGIGSKLMDCLRSSFLPGEYLEVDDIAFSVPTVDGRIFAQKYTKREDYLVYTGW